MKLLGIIFACVLSTSAFAQSASDLKTVKENVCLPFETTIQLLTSLKGSFLIKTNTPIKNSEFVTVTDIWLVPNKDGVTSTMALKYVVSAKVPRPKEMCIVSFPGATTINPPAIEFLHDLLEKN